MKKILIANDCLVGGGVENMLETLVRYLTRQEYDVTLMIPNCTQAEVQALYGKTVKVHPPLRSLTDDLKRYSLAWFWDRGMYVLQREWCRIPFFFRQYDVLIALKEGPTMLALSRLYAKKKIAWIHVDYQFLHWTKGYFRSLNAERKCMKKFNHVVCVSEAAKNAVIQTTGDPGNLCVRYNPLDYAKIQTQAQCLCPEPRSAKQVQFISIGRLSPEKNYHILLDVCSQLEKKYHFSLWILGDGPQKNELQEKIQQKSIQSVKLLGNQQNPFPFVKAADVFVSSSMCESYGLAVQEALILGKPVIAVKCPAIEETLDSRFGILVDNHAEFLYAAMEKMLLDSALYQQYADSIAQNYQTGDLYEKRLQDICSLWE